MMALFLIALVVLVVPCFHGIARAVLERGFPFVSSVCVWPVRLLAPRPAQSLARRLEAIGPRFLAWLEPFWDRLADYSRNPMPLLAAFAITVGAHLLANVSVYSTMHSAHADVSYLNVCWIYAAISALVTIPITISGFGVREQANVSILGPLGVTPERALAVSFISFSIGFIWSLPGALLQFGLKAKAPDRPASPDEQPPAPAYAVAGSGATPRSQ
jgi:uncharacterized membrane protein YbhN (UPF0104 family)